MIITLLAMAALLDTTTLKVEPVFELETIPETNDQLLQQPEALAVDAQGRIYVLDVMAKTVFVWGADGKFLQTIGKEGEGPGEFTFKTAEGRLEGHLDVKGDKVYVYDGTRRNLNVFGSDFKFISASPFTLSFGHFREFNALDKDRFLILNSAYRPEPHQKVAIYGLDATELNELVKGKDRTWQWMQEDGKRKLQLNVYAPQLFMGYNAANDHVIVGDSAQPSFKVFNSDGKLLKTVNMEIPRVPVQDDDKTEFLEDPSFKKNDFTRASFPDFKSYYDQILPVGDKGYLVLHKSPVLANYKGYMVDPKGKLLGRFTYACGEGGELKSAYGMIFAIRVDEGGEYAVTRLSVEP